MCCRQGKGRMDLVAKIKVFFVVAKITISVRAIKKRTRLTLK